MWLRLASALTAASLFFAPAAIADPPAPPDHLPLTARHVCALILEHARINSLPPEFFARLIWKESRFDANAVSPAGAEGIAQFMPGTARRRGLADPFNVYQALPASAKYLSELKTAFGNLGLAAAAYNAGEYRVTRWLETGGFLPLETENYVIDILGEAADVFADPSHTGTIHPLDPEKPFMEACAALPVTRSATVPMASIPVKPWGIQVAGNPRRAAAIRQWQRVKGRFAALLADHEPVVSRVRSPGVPRGIYAVRIGAETRAEADVICQKLRGAGGACVVLRNR
ncbi:lytic transglycosylase domain-containing protein [Mesorhizobium xinjiangense]|uniref:lytic transglycosylase domain-containing protein n=1 Tax=Mesorhizobium xinjiangense TaxID=2678685 RepID=UPI0012EE7453|nr:lytic transglycosylase domain-containing protein [Mesorhizobium xinjiangense]